MYTTVMTLALFLGGQPDCGPCDSCREGQTLERGHCLFCRLKQHRVYVNRARWSPTYLPYAAYNFRREFDYPWYSKPPGLMPPMPVFDPSGGAIEFILPGEESSGSGSVDKGLRRSGTVTLRPGKQFGEVR